MPSTSVALMHLYDKIGLQQCIPLKDHRLKESSKITELIAKHESERGAQNIPEYYPIDFLVSKYLKGHKPPQDPKKVSDLLDQFHEIFKDMPVKSWEGKYAIDIFRNLLNFWSYTHSKLSLQQTLEDKTLWSYLHSSLAKNDVAEISERLKSYTIKWKLSANPDIDLYSILKDPQQKNTHLKDAIKELISGFKTIPSQDLEDAYNLVMAHDFIGHSVESSLVSDPSWEMVLGLQHAWHKLYPGFELGDVDVMDYKCHMLLKNPEFLAHAKWNHFIDEVQPTFTHQSQYPNNSFFAKVPRPYDLLNYGIENYRQFATMMVDLQNQNHPAGLVMLMRVTNYLPKGPRYLLEMLQEERFQSMIQPAIKSARLHKWSSADFWPEPCGSLAEINEIKQFVEALAFVSNDERKIEISSMKKTSNLPKWCMWSHSGRIFHSLQKQIQEPQVSLDEAWRASWQRTKIANMKIGRAVFSFHPSVEKPWSPFDNLVLEDV
ncbi:hypothetical protein DFH28DRAFT_927681 [Melampsora americana]|nr:hypothetical protein DFH28DRAFT_927681 [Melampsora americana]